MPPPPSSAEEAQLQRIAERRAQLEAKVKAKRAGTQGDGEETLKAGAPTISRGVAQVQRSRTELSSKKFEADDVVSMFRVKTDAEENERRIRDESLQHTRIRKTEDEAASANHRKGTIQLNFESLYQIKVPQELAKEIELQKEACRKVIEIKDQLIEELKSQLRDKEEEYVKSLKDQTDDIDALIVEMHSRTKQMVRAYREELLSIEGAYSQERREQLDQCGAEIEAVMKARGERELELKKKRDQAIAEGEQTLDTKYLESAEAYNICKMVNQQNVHKIAQELEQYKAEYMLNAERLNYNLQVLRERVKENKNAQNQHKRKLTRLQDVLSQLIGRYAEADKRFRQANTELTEGYRRVTEQYKDLQLKFQHFEKADVEKYQQVWDMHEGECMTLVQKCLQGDRVVFEELLGLPWVPPTLDFWVAGESELLDGNTAVGSEFMDGAQLEPLEISEAANTMLQILYTQAPFVIEEKAKDAITTLEQATDADMKIETLLHTLGIQRTEQVNELLEYFTIEADEDGGVTQINPQDAVQALYTYLDERKKKKAVKLELTKSEHNTTTTKVKQEQQKRKAERDYWKRMAAVIPEDHQRIWRSLEKGLEKYLGQLKQRSELIDEVDRIRNQNDELRALLNQYLSSGVNDELYSPPQLQVVANPNQ